MFCNRCGAEMQPNSSACPKCFRRIGDPVSAVAQSRLERHLQTLGILWMVLGALIAIPAAGLMLFGHGFRYVVHQQERLPAAFGLLFSIGGAVMLIVAAGGLCVGLGLMQRAPWARTAAIVLGILAILHPPFGTALGIYTLWVLLADEHGTEYRYLSGGS